MVDNVVIMAGGAGKRLWPASVANHPKQFMKVGSGSSLFRVALDRAFGIGISGSVFVVTHEDHVHAAVRECQSLPAEQRKQICIMAEPISRNTAAALALSAAGMSLVGKSHQTQLVMPADHLISPIEAFTASVEIASKEAANGYIVPYGIVPLKPAIEYGYIEVGREAGEVYEVLSFREKPDEATAKRYIESGCHYWNAGIFTYRTDVFLEELWAFEPEIAHSFTDPEEAWFKQRKESGISIWEPTEKLRERYKDCPAKSVDYAVMERSGKIRMVKAAFEWNDVGSWDEIANIGAENPLPVYTVRSSGNFVYSDRPVALCGVEDLIVVSANGKLMICKMGMSQLVKDLAEKDLK